VDDLLKSYQEELLRVYSS